jgi:hypothetical protein
VSRCAGTRGPTDLPTCRKGLKLFVEPLGHIVLSNVAVAVITSFKICA